MIREIPVDIHVEKYSLPSNIFFSFMYFTYFLFVSILLPYLVKITLSFSYVITLYKLYSHLT